MKITKVTKKFHLPANVKVLVKLTKTTKLSGRVLLALFLKYVNMLLYFASTTLPAAAQVLSPRSSNAGCVHKV